MATVSGPPPPPTTTPRDEDDDPLLRSLNEAQRRAVTSTAQTVAILAGPGSGKTHTLTSRVAWLIRRAGYEPSGIILATFTVKAAREMKARIGRILGQECERRIVLGTFHSIARRYLSAYGALVGLDPKFGIADDGDSRAIIRRICKRHDLKVDPAHARSWISKKKAKGRAEDNRGGGGRGGGGGKQQQPENPELLECFREYEEHLARAGLLDYDDLLVRCVHLLQQHPQCVSNVQAVLIDEYQDTNGVQYELMKLFAQARRRITIVGDPDQSIYGWRSAEVRNLYRLLRDYPSTDEISLQENYRSSQAILDVALHVIQQDTRRYQKVLVPVHAQGSQPVLRRLKSAAAEGDWVVAEMKRFVGMSGAMLTFDDVAILLRSASLSRHLEAALGKAGIPYRMVGGHKFYDRKEIKVLLDYLRVVHQPDNNDALARVINVPRRGIGETTIQRLLEEADREKLSLWSLLRKHCLGQRKAKTKILPKMEQKLNAELLKLVLSTQQQQQQQDSSDSNNNRDSLVSIIERLISRLAFRKYLEAEYPEDHEQRWANVQELVSLAGDFVRDAQQHALDDEDLPDIQGLEQARNDSVLGKFLANVALASDAQKDLSDTAQAKPTVTISTIHAAKGLEWPVVFVPAVYAGSIPHARAEDADEERRLLYVAMTRAQALLYLSCPLYGPQGGGLLEPSPFVGPFARAFAQQGPAFERPVLAAVGTILGRQVPTEKAILSALPPMFPTLDDQFPVDPAAASETDAEHFSRAPKRVRQTNMNMNMNMNAADQDEDQDEDGRSWHKDYATTMEQASSFTIASLPGFTTAGALSLSTLAAAQKPSKPRHLNKNQKNLLAFVTAEPRTSTSTAASTVTRDTTDTSLSLARYKAAAARSAARAIDPALAQHKLPSGKLLAPPGRETKDEPAKQYACFSSSPLRGDEQAKEEGQTVKAEPATSFHTTTFSALGRGRGKAGARRPMGLGPPPGMPRLCKPFKPLTIPRPPGPS